MDPKEGMGLFRLLNAHLTSILATLGGYYSRQLGVRALGGHIGLVTPQIQVPVTLHLTTAAF